MIELDPHTRTARIIHNARNEATGLSGTAAAVINNLADELEIKTIQVLTLERTIHEMVKKQEKEAREKLRPCDPKREIQGD